MFLITSVRIVGWYTHGIWSSPLLWCFFVALAFIALGFLLFALQSALTLSPFLSVHAFAVGTIGIMTAGMMARVSTGHTGRSLKAPAKLLSPSLLLLALAAVVRVLLPPLSPDHYSLWINLSAVLWICAYSGLTICFLSVWTSPRVDGKYG